MRAGSRACRSATRSALGPNVAASQALASAGALRRPAGLPETPEKRSISNSTPLIVTVTMSPLVARSQRLDAPASVPLIPGKWSTVEVPTVTLPSLLVRGGPARPDATRVPTTASATATATSSRLVVRPGWSTSRSLRWHELLHRNATSVVVLGGLFEPLNRPSRRAVNAPQTQRNSWTTREASGTAHARLLPCRAGRAAWNSGSSALSRLSRRAGAWPLVG